MGSESAHAQYRDPTIWRACEEMGEQHVLAALGNAEGAFVDFKQRQHAWAWVFDQRLKRKQNRSESVISITKWACLLALGGFLIALLMAFRALM